MELLSELGKSFLVKLVEESVDLILGKKDKATLESLQYTIGSLRAKAIDVEEEIKNIELSGKKKRKREVHEWLEHVAKIGIELCVLENKIQMGGFVKKFFAGDQAAKLDERVCDLVEQCRHFGELVIDVNDNRGERLLTKELVGEEFNTNLDKIWRLFSSDGVSSIGIYGMGGVGKTILAKHINNRFLDDSKKCVLWISISQESPIIMLQDIIAKFLGLDLSKEHNEDIRASRLNKVLSKKKNVVFILDDVWKHINLEKLGDPISVNGCQVLITTRLRKVCHQIGCKEVLRVKTLKENEGWNLFEKELGQQNNLSPEVQNIAMSIVKVCNGLPLGIITIAGNMKGETEFHVWKDALTELSQSVMRQEDMDEQVFKVLKYSFDRLDRDEGKSKCFLYCSLYPKDFKIDGEELIRKFILEGFLKERNTWEDLFLEERKTREDLFLQGRNILDQLVNASLLERVDDDPMRKYNQVKMHNLVRAMALKITEGKTKVIAGHYNLKEIPVEEEWDIELEKISLMRNNITTIPDRLSPNCPILSTLLLEHNLDLEFIPNSFFMQIRSLFVLDLSWTNIKKLPDSLSDMKSLKALLLIDCRKLEYVPDLGELKQLRELDLTNTAIQETPIGMEELINLKFLSLKGCNKLVTLSRSFLENFPCLQCLRLPCHIQI